MKWYLIALIVYAAIIFINVFALWVQMYKPFRLENLFVLLLCFLLFLIITPFMALVLPYYYVEKSPKQYKRTKMHALTEHNKTALCNMGFHACADEADYNSGLRYTGYRRGDIIVHNDGEIVTRYTHWVSRDDRQIVQILLAMPNDAVAQPAASDRKE